MATPMTRGEPVNVIPLTSTTQTVGGHSIVRVGNNHHVQLLNSAPTSGATTVRTLTPASIQKVQVSFIFLCGKSLACLK